MIGMAKIKTAPQVEALRRLAEHLRKARRLPPPPPPRQAK